jgi:ABC-type sugar transport system permease subunit
MRNTRQEKLTGWLLVAPATVFVAAFVAWPTVHMLLTSGQDVGLGRRPAEWVGGQNYHDLWVDPVFWQSVWNTAWFTLLVVPLQTAAALGFAVWVNRPGVSARFLRAAVFLPTTVSLAVLSVVWDLLYEPATATGAGLLNGLLQALHLPPQPFLSSADQALYAIVVMSVWQGVGLQMMVFLSGLQQVPEQLHEAARLDGANRWQDFRHVTLPQLAPTTVFVVMVTMIFALRLFVQPFLMTRGGPENATISVVQYIYEKAFFERNFGLACAAGSVFFVLVFGVTLGLRRLLRAAEAKT